MKRFLAGILALGLILSLTACKEASAEKQVFAMDTVMMLTAYGDQSEEALKAAELELYRLDSLLSKTDEGSTVSALNGAAGAATTVEGEVLELLELAKVYSGETGGAFDITISPVVSAWGFTEDAYRVPDEAELKEWSNRFASVTAKSYMRGYRDIYGSVGLLHKLMIRFCDGLVRMKIVKIVFGG